MASATCYRGVGVFEQYQNGWIGQFQLNVVQLMIARLPALPADRVKDEVAEISRLLEISKRYLRSVPAGSSSSDTDFLLGSGPFDDQLQQVEALKSLVAQIRPQE